MVGSEQKFNSICVFKHKRNAGIIPVATAELAGAKIIALDVRTGTMLLLSFSMM
jgi:hypothetical protein